MFIIVVYLFNYAATQFLHCVFKKKKVNEKYSIVILILKFVIKVFLLGKGYKIIKIIYKIADSKNTYKKDIVVRPCACVPLFCMPHLSQADQADVSHAVPVSSLLL